jgi:predicted AAA+ superfamily ATPase
VYDLHRREHAILVTGSARLDVYGRGGDSLQGRYFLHRLHPFTFSELSAVPFADDVERIVSLGRNAPPGADGTLAELLRFGGFPEPLLAGSERRAARWRQGYGERLIRGDIRDLENLRDLDRVEMLYERLPALVGSVLSINALREDLEVAFDTVKSWLSVLERLYASFRVPPFGVPRIKAVKKEQKLYLWDWARVDDAAARFENLVLLHLLRLVHWLIDEHGERAELRYFRTTAGHEVDAVILRKGKPWVAVEVKSDDRPLDAGLVYLLQRVRIPYAFQVVLHGRVDARGPDINGCRVRRVPATRFLASLP